MFKSARRMATIATVGVAVSVGMAGAGAAAFADTTVSPTITAPAPSGGSCFTATVFTASFNANGTPKSVEAGSVTFNKPVLSCI
jgi:hypothetical protein